MKKNYSRQIFVLLTRRIYKISKKRNLGFTWNDSQKWVSANLFQLYNNLLVSQNVLQLSIDEIRSHINIDKNTRADQFQK